MKTFLKIAGSVICFIIIAALVAPLFLNINSYKNDIAAQLEKHLDRKVAIDGDIKLRFLPLPSIKIKNMKIASIPGAQEPYLAQIGSLGIHIQFWPLLRGHIGIDKIKLDHARIVLEELPNKAQNWQLAVISSSSNPRTVDDQRSQSKSRLSLDIRNIQLKQCEVVYISPQTRQALKNINLDVIFTSLNGPYQFKGNLEYMNQKLNLDGKVDQLANVIPAELNLDLFGQNVSLNGQIDLQKKNFEGIVKMRGHAKDLQKLYPGLKSAAAILQGYKVKSNLSVTLKKLTAKNIDLVYGNINAVGNASLDLNTLQSMAQLQVNPGKASFAFTSQPKPESIFNGSVTFSAQDLTTLLNALKLPTTDLPQDFPKSFKIAADISYAKDHLTLSKFVFNQGKARLEGMFSQSLQSKKPLYKYEFKTPDLLPLAKIFMPDFTLNLGAVALKGETMGSPDALKTDTHLMAAQANLCIQGNLQIKDTKHMAYNLALLIRGPSLKSTLAALNIDAGLKNLGQFSVTTNIKGDGTHILAQNFIGEVALPKSLLNWKGSLEATHSPIRPKISATLTFGSINLDELLAESAQKDWDLWNKGQFILVANHNNHDQPLPKHSRRWSHEKIDLSFLKLFDGDFKMRSSNVEYASISFKNLEGNARLVNGILEIPQLTAQTYGGTISLKGRASSQQTQPINLKLSMTGANLKEIAHQKGKITIAYGDLDLHAELNSAGRSEFEYIKNLSGAITLKARKGAIDGFNLQKISDQLGQVNNLGSALRLLNTSFEGGQTRFTNLDGVFSINEGIVRITQLHLQAEGATAQATGKVNLPSYTLNIDTTVKLNETKFPPFGVRFFGSLDEPQRELSVDELKQYLMQNVFKSVIENVVKNKKKPRQIVKDILGVGNQEKPANDEQPSQKPSNDPPGDSVKDPVKAIDTIIKGLF